MRPVLLCYIHGFLSGPNAAKATALRAYIEAHQQELSQLQFDSPDFPEEPEPAFNTLRQFIRDCKSRQPEHRIVLVGSSMGGFFSSLLGAEFNCKMVLLNPCTHPQEHFLNLIGPQYNAMTERHFELTPDMLPYLTKLDHQVKVRPELTRVYLGSEDEVLDYRKSLLRYNNCEICFVPGEDHAFTHNFAALIPGIMDFALQP